MVQKTHCQKDPIRIVKYLNTLQADKEKNKARTSCRLAPILPLHLQNRVLTSLCELFRQVVSLPPPPHSNFSVPLSPQLTFDFLIWYLYPPV